MKKPIEKYLGMRCIACHHFSHKAFGDLASRLAYGRRDRSDLSPTFGRCDAIGANDAIGAPLVAHEQSNPACRFESAGAI